MTEKEIDFRTVWRARWQTWHARLDQAGLGGLAKGLEMGLKPLGPLAAQVLYFSQPGFALFGQYDSIGALAGLLEDLPDQPADEHATTGFKQ